MSWTMPAETARHDRVWMAFPRPNTTLAESAADAETAYTAWSTVANTVSDFEPVTVVVDPTEVARARTMLTASIDIIEAELDDAWMRDIGPTFVTDGAGHLAAVDWTFNGWGAQEWAEWDNDRRIGRVVAEAAGVPVISSMLVQEGGAIHVDGEGTVLVTETVQLDPGRNPYATTESVEAELARTIGAQKVIWLPRGLTRDYERFGTRGHVDMVATIPSPGTLLLHEQPNPEHPDNVVMHELRDFLAGTTDAAGRRWDIVDLPAPDAIRDETGFVDYSYINHLVVNDGVIACGYGEPAADERAAEILASVYPGRRVVTIDAREILARGGGIHCITQQQPAVGDL
ncbi:agmatine deiminase family protein [Gordonia polyisoprenivorans]|uniref:agmatine deiminase family protein n=1 Tax=Gordonia polyisoprenivorans TaxID=84595 RepID=UPI001AD67E7E|nr:agmatine deiminase family protein [Gordonia polyisoprenivorans]QTI67485.1 agmatine deiminase family protein [Gordonia polyisoprenivorans]